MNACSSAPLATRSSTLAATAKLFSAGSCNGRSYSINLAMRSVKKAAAYAAGMNSM